MTEHQSGSSVNRREMLGVGAVGVAAALAACTPGTDAPPTSTRPPASDGNADYLSIADAGKAHRDAPGAWWRMVAEDADRASYRLICKDGDDLFGALMRFAAEENVQSGSYEGIGAVREVKLGWLDRGRRQYKVNHFPHQYEAMGIVGNFGTVIGNAEPAVASHTHMGIAGDDSRTYAGHLIEAIASPTIEVTVNIDKRLSVTKHLDASSGVTIYQS